MGRPSSSSSASNHPPGPTRRGSSRTESGSGAGAVEGGGGGGGGGPSRRVERQLSASVVLEEDMVIEQEEGTEQEQEQEQGPVLGGEEEGAESTTLDGSQQRQQHPRRYSSSSHAASGSVSFNDTSNSNHNNTSRRNNNNSSSFSSSSSSSSSFSSPRDNHPANDDDNDLESYVDSPPFPPHRSFLPSSLPFSAATRPSRPFRYHRPSCCLPSGWACTARALGIIFSLLGSLALLLFLLSHTILPSLRDRTVLNALIVSSPSSSSYGSWASPSTSPSDSPLLTSYYFYSILNPTPFLTARALPLYLEKGPYVFKQRTSKTSVSFSEDGTLVSYVSLTQNDFVPEKSIGTLKDQISLFNMPYATAVATVGSESGLLRAGVRGALGKMKVALFEDFLPTMREASAVFAATTAIKMMQENLAKIRYPENGVAVRWGGGCVPVGLQINHCGFSSMAYLRAVLNNAQQQDIALIQLCLETNLDATPGRVLPLATVEALWNKEDRLSLFNTERDPLTSKRYGIALWLKNDPDKREEIMMHFKINLIQYNALQRYIATLYDSPVLEEYVLKTFLKALPPADAELSRGEVSNWEALVWRQWTVGDVVQVLNSRAVPTSVMPAQPPELAFYMEKAGVPVWDYTRGSVNRWPLAQARCFFNASLSSSTYFQETILGLPPPHNKSPRPQFNRPELLTTPLLRPITECMSQSKDALKVMQGYIDHLAFDFVKPVVEEEVINKNGGLVVTRSVESWLTGREEPILKLSLEPDDPRILFSFMGTDLTLAPEGGTMGGKGVCRMSNDVENSVTACRQVRDEVTGAVMRYEKTPNTYHTGKHFPERVGQMVSYRGDEDVWGVWPKTTIKIKGAALAEGSKVQYGHSEGMQFPPMNRVERAIMSKAETEKVGAGGASNGTAQVKTLESLAFMNAEGNEQETALPVETDVLADPASADQDQLSVFLSKFILPLRFRYDEPVMLRGIRLLKFGLSPLTYSPQRADAAGFSMLSVKNGGKEGMFNLTDLQTMPAFLSPPHFFGYPNIRQMPCLAGLNFTTTGAKQAARGSYLAVEPYTGKTMSAHIAMQVSGATTTASGNGPSYDVWHHQVYKAEIIPTLWMAQSAEIGPEDARTFHDLIYRSASILALIQRYSFMGGIAALALGMGLLLLSCFLARRKQRQEERMIGEEEEERRAADMEAAIEMSRIERNVNREAGPGEAGVKKTKRTSDARPAPPAI